MNADMKDKAGGALKTIWGYSRMFAINTLRRAVILSRYTLICWQQQRLRCAQGKVGREVLKALEQGEVNPMLTEGVKDALKKAEGVRARKEKQYQAIAGIREKIRTSCAFEPPAGAQETPPVQEAPPAEEPPPAAGPPPAEEPKPTEESPPTEEPPPAKEPTPPEGGTSGASGQ
ncbi:MAG: hypothetical protein ACOZF2_12040 [Thermodesulfobacteriota bacterium]